MFKQKFSILFACLILSSYSLKSQTIDEFGKKIHETYKVDISQQNRLYISKPELKRVLNSHKITPGYQYEYISSIIGKQEEFINLSKYDWEIHFNDYDWKNSSIDSITYHIIFPQPGTDSIIKWPQSLNTSIKNIRQLYLLDIFIYANDKNKKIKMSLNAVLPVGKEFKLFENRPKLEYME